jgi:hypothetical protein
MLPPQQWDELHLKVWSWLRGKPLQGYVQFDMGCDIERYGNKVETTMKIHLQNLLGENYFESVQKPSLKGYL